MLETNSYTLSRAFWNFSFDNPEKLKPAHVALYFFIVEHCNRLGWKEKFGLPTTMAMDAIGIKSYRQYKNTLDELIQYGFLIMVQKSKNQYSANVVSLVENVPSNKSSLDKAIIQHQKCSVLKDISNGITNSQTNVCGDGCSNICTNGCSNVSIDKPITNNHITNNHIVEFENFRKVYKGTKGGKEKEFQNFIKKTKDWKEVLPLLMPALQREILYKQALIENNKFCPEWKNLQTWINQRCWEQEFAPIEARRRKTRVVL